MLRLLLIVTVVAATLLLGQGFLSSSENHLPIEQAEKNPGRRQLQRAAWNTGGWVILYQANDAAAKATYEKLFLPITEKPFRGINIVAFPMDEAPDSLLKKYPVVVVGTKLPTAVKEKITSVPALGLQSEQLQLGSLLLQHQDDIAHLTYLPSAWQDSLPMHLIWANDQSKLQTYVEERLNQGVRSFIWSAWGYEVIRQGATYYLGYFNDSTWVMDKKIHFDFSAEDATKETASAKIRCYDGAQPPDDDWLAQLAATQEEIRLFTGLEKLAPLNIYLYPSVERKALRTNSMEQVHLSDDLAIAHIVNNAYFRGAEWGVQYCSWLRAALGEPAIEVFESGLAMQWVDTIRDQPWRHWVQKLAAADALTPANMLFDPVTLKQQSPVIGQLTAGAWIDYRLSTIGKAKFLEEYRTRSRPPTKAQYERFINWIKANYLPEAINRPPLPEHRLNGFTLAHEGYRIYNGYGGSRARLSLEAMQAIGIEAVAIVPYSFMSDPQRPDPIPVARRAGTENDEAVLFSHFAAKDLGQFTLLKPQVWLGGGSWPGDVSFENEQDWHTFFKHYGQWIQHYALLSEMYGLDAFCMGTELRYTTLKKPEEWRKLIRSVRKIYSGALTYAANWGEECEKLSFWEEFDFVGINCYYPLYKGTDPSDEDLARGAERVIKKMETVQQKANRPVWLTEIGYRSATAPWQHPHAEADQRAVDEIAQARSYEAILKASQNVSWIKGFFWWKWPSDLDNDEDRGRGYMPLGKPAEEVVRKYYQQVSQQ